ncbi:fungal-specific transcription factor domain-containing protein [Aspergillus karnatakaensis]|uniref:fungal specific transcription factor domain-containing protein n=1 Tax=Aspergillus karnatakaensis TaxID=1810916 RepID=UPI003CCE0511
MFPAPPPRLHSPDFTFTALVGVHMPNVSNYYSIFPATTSLPNSISAMGAAVGDIRETDIRDQYFGQTSIVSLVQECAHTPPRRQPTRPTQLTATPSVNTPVSCNVSCETTTHSALLSDDYALPPRKTADFLLDVYFNSPHLFYPWVHKASFMTTYNYIWTANGPNNLNDLPDVGVGGRDCPTAVFYCALNAMLALGCEFSNLPSHAKRSTSLMFSERMKALISIDIFDSGSLAHVQALLLVATYLQCTAYPKRCWNVVGMAHRISIGIGLHLSRQAKGFTRLEREMRWRAWCACVHLDMYLAEDEAVPPPGEVSRNQYLYENMRLIEILSNILSRIYHCAESQESSESSRKPEVDLQAMVDLDRAFDDFEASLDPALRWNTADSRAGSMPREFKRQSNVLHARFLHLRLLLYRPAFTEYCSSAASNSTGDRWSGLCRANCASGCVQAACALVHSLSRATTEDATGAWWYGVFYLISAGIILLLADSSGVQFEGAERGDRESAWEKCIETLHRMADVHPSGRDYAIALSGLKQQGQPNSSSEPSNGAEAGTDLNGMPWDGQHEARLLEASNLGHPSYNILDPLMSHWDNGIGDIMLPAQFLQELDDGLLLPSLF